MTLLGYWSVRSATELDHRFGAALAGSINRVLRGPGWAIASESDAAALTDAVPVTDGTDIAGAVVGQFFAGSTAPFTTPASLPLTALRCDAAAPPLPWGRWAAAAVTDGGASLLLSRDALGMQRLFIAEYGDGYVFASDLTALLRLLGRTPGVNWEFFATYLVHDATPGSATGFDGVYELPQASTVWYRQGAVPVRRRYWDPFEVARQPLPATDPEELRALFEAWVAAGTRDSPALLCDLSGGLDSSSVTWAALRTGKDVTAVYLDDRLHGGADEWTYASNVARRLGVDVLRLAADDALPLTPSGENTRFDTPTVELMLQAENAARVQLAPGIPSLTGTGGDQVFLSSAADGMHLHDYLLQQPAAFGRRLVGHSRQYGVPLTAALGTVLADEITRWRGGERLLARKQFHHGSPIWLTPEYRPSPTVRAQAAAALTDRFPRLPATKLLHAAEVATCATSAAAVSSH